MFCEVFFFFFSSLSGFKYWVIMFETIFYKIEEAKVEGNKGL